MAVGRPVFLAADEFDPDQLRSKVWSQESDHVWRVPADLDPESLLETSLHNEGSYGLFACASKSNVERMPELPWWGPSNSQSKAARMLHGLRQAGIDLALMVHADASDWIVAIPNGLEDVQRDTT